MVGHCSPWALGQFASPDLLSSRLAAGPLSSNGHVLGRLQRSTYIQVRLALQAPSGLVWLATCPSAGVQTALRAAPPHDSRPLSARLTARWRSGTIGAVNAPRTSPHAHR